MTEAEQMGRLAGAAYRFVLPRRALRGGIGAELGLKAGESLEFQDYRDYTPGDDLRNLDWTVLARTDREVIRIRREEIAPVIEIFRDRSASMNIPPEKASAADYLVGLLTAAAPTCRVVTREEPKTPHAVRIVLSDLLTDEDPDRRLARLAHQAAAVIVIRLLADEERNPPSGGTYECHDSETGEIRELTMNDETLGAYRKALSAHTARWEAAVRRHGGIFCDLTTATPDFTQALCQVGLFQALI